MELEGFPCYYLFHLYQAEYTRGKHRWHHPRERKDMPSAGIFSQRNKDRPHNIGMTVVSVFSVDDAFLTVQGLDAIDGTPLLDIKPYSPLYDKREATLPEWIERLPEHSF